MAVFLSPVGGVAAQFFTNTGAVLTGGKLYTYLAGTTTPAATYTSAAGATFNTNPIVLDSAGRVPSSGEIWLGEGVQYKFVLKDSNDVLIGTYDNVTGINSNFVNYNALEEIQVATAGQTVFNLTNSYQPGTNTLSVFVDGVNQYDGSSYSYTETNSTRVTFTQGLHVGALVKFTTATTLSAGVVSSNLVTYLPAGTGAVQTTVQAKLRQTVSVIDFGAVGDFNFSTVVGTDNTAAFQAAVNSLPNGGRIYVPHGYYLLNTAVSVTHGIEIVGDGQVNFNGYATITPTSPNGGSLIVVANGVDAFTFNKGSNDTAFGNSFRDLSFSSKVISESAYGAAPSYPANTNAINMSYTAEMFVDNVGFMNIDKCFYNTASQRAVKPYISNIAIKDCNYGFSLNYLAADFTVTNVSCIKANYFIYTNRVDGFTLSDSTIYRSYVSSWKCEPKATAAASSSYFNITGTKFFESGNIECDFDYVSQITIAGTDFVRAGLVSGFGTGNTALSVKNCEVFTIGGSTIERPTGNGAYIYNTRVVEFAANIKEFGWGVGGYTGLIADANIVLNINSNISGFNGSPLAAANLTNNYFVGGNITSDDVVYGQTTYLQQNGVQTVTTSYGTNSVIPNNGDQPLGSAISYTLQPGQSLVIYNLAFTPGGTGVGVTGLVFRYNSTFSPTLDSSGNMNIRKVVQTNSGTTALTDTFNAYLHNSSGSNFTWLANQPFTFLYKIVQTTLPEYA